MEFANTLVVLLHTQILTAVCVWDRRPTTPGTQTGFAAASETWCVDKKWEEVARLPGERTTAEKFTNKAPRQNRTKKGLRINLQLG